MGSPLNSLEYVTPPRASKVRDMMETREKGALRCKVDKEEHLKIYGGLKEGIGMKAYLHRSRR